MSDIVRWLEELGLGKYAPLFAESEVDFVALPEITEDDLREIGLPIGPRRKILKAIRELGEHQTEASGPVGALARKAERRQLTVLFCDLVGSVELGDRMDVEDYRALLARVRAAMVAPVTRYDGFVARHQGDGLLVYFGYPQAHEGDAERAVRAGLEVVQAVETLDHPYGADLRVRVGIATGPAVVGDVLSTGASERAELAALGTTPNLAARLQMEAEPNTVVISETTQALAAGLFELEALPARSLKGFADEITPYRAKAEVRGQSRFAARSHRHLSPFVGRAEELELLARRWSQVRKGRGHVDVIMGEAGIGKSRLVEQLRDHIGADPHESVALQCSPYHGSSELYPVIAAFERVLGPQADEDENRVERLQRHLAEMNHSDEQTLGLIAQLLAIPVEGRFPSVETMDASRRRDQTLRALVGYLDKRAQRAPVLCVFEDGHWIDPSTGELLGRLVEAVASKRVMLIVTTRPGFEAQWTDLPHVRVLNLSRLDLLEGKQLAQTVAAAAASLSAQVLDTILSRAAGNPLFIEELTRAVIQSAKPLTADRLIPSTLRDSLMARLDASEEGKVVAQVASAIGREVPLDLLSAVWEGTPSELSQGLDALEHSGLLTRRGEDELTRFVFKHALVRDAAYESLLREERTALHSRVAPALDTLYPDIRLKQPELLAQHYAKAASPQTAVKLWLTAARKALSRSANVETIAHVTAAQELLPSFDDPDERDVLELELKLALGPALMNTRGSASKEVGSTYRQALELSNRVGGLEHKFTATWGLWLHHEMSGEFEPARRRAEEVVGIGRELPDSTYLLQGHHAAWTTADHVGNHADSVDHVDQGIALYDIERHRQSIAMYGDHDPGVCAYCHKALGSWFLGYPDQAVVFMDDALTLAEKVRHPLSVAAAQTYAGIMHQLRREPAIVLKLAERLMENSVENQLPSWQRNGEILLGWARTALGDARGLEMLSSALEARAETGSKLRQVYYLAIYAELLGRTDQVEAGLDAIERARSLFEQTEERRWEPLVHIVRGQLLHRAGDDRLAESSFELGIQTAQRNGAMSFKLGAACRLARLWCQQGKRGGAHELLAPVYEWFTEGFDTCDLQEAKALLSEMS